MKKYIITLILMAMPCVLMADFNPTPEEVLEYAKVVEKKQGVPAEIIYGIAAVESEFHQFIGTNPFVTKDGGIGLMQVTPKASKLGKEISIDRLKWDWRYNVDVAVSILIDKYNRVPEVLNTSAISPKKWYLALWAYNGYAGENNPHQLPMVVRGEKKTKAYQDLVMDKINGTQRKKIVINKEGIPKKGVPRKDIWL